MVSGSRYENLNRFLTPFFQKLPGANIETNTQDARKALVSLTHEDDEQSVSFDVKSLYTNVPNGEAIEIALRERSLFKQPSSTYRKVRHEKFVKACSDTCSF